MDIPQVHVAPHILGGKTSIGDKYILRLMFFIDNKVPATNQASGICPTSYSVWENRYQ